MAEMNFVSNIIECALYALLCMRERAGGFDKTVLYRPKVLKFYLTKKHHFECIFESAILKL